MNRDQAVSQIQFILGKRSDLVAEITTQLQFAQNELEKRLELPIFLREETLILGNTIDVERMAPPPGFLREWEEDALWVYNENLDLTEPRWDPLVKDSPKFLRQAISNDAYDPARPRGYSYDGKDFILFPTPDAVYTYRMIYYKADEVLSSNIENKWLKHFPYLLIGLAGGVIAAGIRDQNALAVFGAMIQEGNDRLNKFTTSRDQAGRRYVMGGED